jgi:crossover junction endodeoxyribonuclease RusA
MIVLTLPYPVSANRYWRPVRIGKHITIVPTKEAKEYRANVAAICATRRMSPIAGRIAIAVRLYPNRPKDFAVRQRKLGPTWDDGVQSIDLDNANKVLLDALKGIAFEDDRWVRRLQAERMEPDQHGARVIVAIEQLAVPVVQGSLIAEAA